MSAIGIQKAAQLLNTLGQQMADIAQFDDQWPDSTTTQNAVEQFVIGVFTRMGYPPADLEAAKVVIAGLAAIVAQPQT